MKLVFSALVIACVAILSSAAPRFARADIQNDVFQVLCMPELDVLEVREIRIHGETAAKAIARHDEHLVSNYHLYTPRWHANLEGGSDHPNFGIRPTRFECRLSSGLAELVILPEPVPYNLLHVDSIAVTLNLDGRTIVDDLPFFPCAVGGPITGLLYNATEGYITLDGRFGGVRPRSSDPKRAFDDTWRLIFVDAKGLHALQQEELDWHAPTPTALTMADLDYAGIDHDSKEGRDWRCRYDGPGSPESRKQL